MNEPSPEYNEMMTDLYREHGLLPFKEELALAIEKLDKQTKTEQKNTK